MSISQGQPGDNIRSDFKGASTPNNIGYRFTDLDPGANIYIQRDDQLAIQWASKVPGETLNVNARILLPGRAVGRTQPDATTTDNKLGDSPYGVIVPISQSFKSAGVGSVNSNTIQLAEGYLLSISITSSLAGSRGQTFARAFIARGPAGIGNSGYPLVADYCLQTAAVGWPIGGVTSPLAGSGNIHSITVTPPVAGTDWTFTPPSNTRVRINSLQATLTTSAAVATRTVSLQVKDSSLVLTLGTYPAGASQVASIVGLYTGGVGVAGNSLLPTVLNVNLPQGLILCNSSTGVDTLSSVTASIQGADVWSAITIGVEEWLDF